MSTLLAHSAQPGPRRLDRPRILPWAGAVALMILVAVLIGSAIAEEKWLYVGMGVAAGLAVLWPVEAALGFYAILLPFQSIAVLGQSQSGTTVNWFLGVLAAAALVGGGAVRKRLSWPSRCTIWWLGFSLWALTTSVWALDRNRSLLILPTVCGVVLLYLAGACWKSTEREISLLKGAIIAGGVAASCFTIHAFMTGVSYKSFWGATSRASLVMSGREANPNFFATDLLLPFSLAIAAFFSSSGQMRKLSAAVCAGLMGYTIFITMSRSAFVSVIVILAVYALRLRLNRRIARLGAALLLLLLVMPSLFFSRLQEAAPTGGAGRVEIWQAGLATFKHYALTGAGLGNFPIAYQSFSGMASRFVGYNRDPHNIYLDVAVDFGIVGVALLCTTLFVQLSALKKIRKANGSVPVEIVALEAAAYGMLVMAAFQNVLWSKCFWFLWLFLALSLRRYISENGSPLLQRPAPRVENAHLTPVRKAWREAAQ